MTVVAVIVLALAVVGGFWGQHLLRRKRTADDDIDPRHEGLPVSELIVPVRLLATLLLAFVLVAVFQSFQDAGDEAAEEAGAVLAMAEDTTMLTPDARTDILGTLRCYALSVTGPDWHAQAELGMPSPATDAAADDVAAALQRATADPRNSVAMGSILSSNADRIATRIERVAEGRPTVPGEVWVLMVVTLAAVVAGLAAYAHPHVRRSTQVAVVAGSAVVFALTLWLLHDLDRPYDGLVRTEPTAMLDVTHRMTTLAGGAPAPCNADGTPLR
ncbi:MAG: DUF4239 domain-containing protein [Pseudonocardiaceae bacterium]|nr:MAG: DUF4239 domain-containing protein [Pseudonocardiaceae bacterium]